SGSVKPAGNGNGSGNQSAVAKGAVPSTSKLAAPKAPFVVLYDQYNNDGANGIVSANRTDNSSLTAETADDFIVPAGNTWTINSVDFRGYPGIPAQGTFNIRFYQNTGTLPGTMVYQALNMTYSGTEP